MALVKCKECGEQVSTSAKACPKCGAKPPKKTSVLTWIVLVIVIFVVYSAFQSSTSTKPSSSPVQSTSTTVVSEAPRPIVPQWDVSTSTDKMTGQHQMFATSPTATPMERLDFPYRDVKANLAVGCDSKSEWAYFYFSTAPNLVNTQTKDGYSEIKTRIKWDEELETVDLTQKWGAAFLHFDNNRYAISKIIHSNTALLELSWYGQSQLHFSFPMSGAAAAVADIRKQCAAK
jgi:RNA polymerase subunit RPABC4/transcription elongation factor Spt4